MVASDPPCDKEKLSGMGKAFDSEERRLKSLKEKKQAFKSKERLVQEALKNLDSKPQNKKIVFDDDVTEEQITRSEKKRNALFDDNSDNDEDYNNGFMKNGKLKTKPNKSEKRLKLQLRYGNDQRFVLDDRFDDDDEDGAEKEQEESAFAEGAEHDLEKEKDWQLSILGDVLGAPVAAKKEKATTSNKRNKMIRYNPMEKGHEEYEITADDTKTKPTKKKAKRSRAEEAAEDANTVPTSNEIYYSVSNNLTNSLKETGTFSLLSKLGKDKAEPRPKEVKVQNVPQEKDRKLPFRADASNAFKYDSSDDDDDVEAPDDKTQIEEATNDGRNNRNNFFRRDTFFFANNDPRFDDALKFFDPNTVWDEDFKSLRRELKQIVRAKIRNNVKKHQPWGRKHKIKRS